VHWVTAEDCLFLRPLLAGFLERALLTSPWRSGLQDLDHDAVAEAARRLVEEEPMTFRQLGLALAERWPGRDPATLAQLARAREPLVQLPPRAVWGRTGQVVVTTAEAWLGRPLDPAPDPAGMLLRYLAGFGPASGMDAQNCCGAPGRPWGRARCCTPRPGAGGRGSARWRTGWATGSSASGRRAGASSSACPTRPGPTRTRRRRSGSCPSSTTCSCPTPTAAGSSTTRTGGGSPGSPAPTRATCWSTGGWPPCGC